MFSFSIVSAQNNYLDTFTTVSYGNNNGSLSFSANWVETNETTNANGGRIQIVSNQLRFRNLDAIEISRTLDLSTVSIANLTLDYDATGRAGETIDVELWNVTTASWDVISTINADAIGSISHTLTTDQMSASSAIRFISRSGGWSGNDEIFIDNVQFQIIPDTDGDGVGDNIDLDDDNDGILDTVECPQLTAGFQNGSFEIPGVVGSWSPVPATSIPGWQTDDPSNNIEVWNSASFGLTAPDGNFNVELQYTNFHNVYQVLSTTPGEVLFWSGYHRGRNGVDVAEVRVGSSLAGATTQISMSDGTAGWGYYSGFYTVPAGQTTTFFVLTPISSNSGSIGSGNLVDGWNVQVSSLVSGVCDADSDGIPNHLDLDADGDGCNDVIEAGFIDPDGDGILGTSPITVDANGQVTGQGGYSTPADLNTNAISDFLEVGPDTNGNGIADGCEADLSLTKTVNDSNPNQGDNITFTIILTNDGPSSANTIEVRDIIPTDFTYTHPDFVTSQGTVTFNAGTRALNWDLGAYFLANGSSLTLTYTVTVDVCGEFKNQVEIIQSSRTDLDSTPNTGN